MGLIFTGKTGSDKRILAKNEDVLELQFLEATPSLVAPS